MASSSPRADGGGAHAAVDAPNLLYHLATAGAQRQAENDEKRLDAVAAAALAWVERFEEQTSYSVLLVREGTAPKAKAPVQQKRQRQKAKAAPATRNLVRQVVQEARRATPSATQGEALRALDPTRRRAVGKALRRATRLSRSDQNYILVGLAGQGFKVVEAPGEAEAQAAVWQKLGCVQVVVSQDFDAFLYGARRVIRTYEDLEVCDAKDEYEKIGATDFSEFLAAYIVAGQTEYAPGHPRATSPSVALQVLREQGGFGAWMNALGATGRPYMDAYQIFTEPTACYCPPEAACICPAHRTEFVHGRGLERLRAGGKLVLGNFMEKP